MVSKSNGARCIYRTVLLTEHERTRCSVINIRLPADCTQVRACEVGGANMRIRDTVYVLVSQGRPIARFAEPTQNVLRRAEHVNTSLPTILVKPQISLPGPGAISCVPRGKSTCACRLLVKVPSASLGRRSKKAPQRVCWDASTHPSRGGLPMAIEVLLHLCQRADHFFL